MQAEKFPNSDRLNADFRFGTGVLGFFDYETLSVALGPLFWMPYPAVSSNMPWFLAMIAYPLRQSARDLALSFSPILVACNDRIPFEAKR